MDDFFDGLSSPPSPVTEPNDTPGTASPLVEGLHTVSGNGLDWYSFVAQAGGIIDISMTATAAPFDLNMVLHNAAGVPVRAAFSATPTETFSHAVPASGTYYLQVTTAQFGTSPPAGMATAYTLDLGLPQFIDPDGNDTRATATPLAAGVHEIVGTRVDWFRLDSGPGLIDIAMTEVEHLAPGDPRDDPRNLNIELYNAAGQAVAASLTTGAESIRYFAAEPGPYFLKVYSAQFVDAAPADLILSYTLDVALPAALPPDGNDSMATATPLGAGQTTRSGTGVDWFRIETGPGVMDIVMTPTATQAQPALDLNMELYNAQGQAVRMGFVDGPNPETIRFVAPETGVYYLKVYWPAYPGGAPNGYNLNYTLDVDLPLNTWSRVLDFGPVRGASVTTYDIDNDGLHEIFVATSKALDAQGNEIRPAGLIVLEHDGTIKWTRTFAAAAGPDSQTGKIYATSSVTTAPVFADINGDGRIEILVGTGGDNTGDFGAVGQPGDRGALHALDANGNLLWSHVTRDSFGAGDARDGRPDGIYGAPRVFDIDGDGVREVIFTSWDHYLYILDGRTGRLEREVNLHDTAGATPAVADLNGDGIFELVVPADITDNPAAGLTRQGGILHVLSNYGIHNVTGWTQQVLATLHPDYRGRFEEQSLWSSPQIVDLNRDGRPEIVVGTGNFFQDERGQYVRVWNADGSLRLTLPTIGRTLASPLVADIDGDGSPDIVAATLQGHVHAWNAAGVPIFATQARPYTDNPGAGTGLPIARAPVAVDLDGDGKLELIVSIGSQMVILDAAGRQISNLTEAERVFHTYSGSPVARDIDRDGVIDLISGGTTEAHDQAVVYRFENPLAQVGTPGRTGAYQEVQSLHNIQSFVERFYTTILGRASDPAGNNGWTDGLHTGVLTGADVARGFVGSPEFIARGTSNAEFVATLYRAFFGRAPDAGQAGWVAQLEAGVARLAVVDGFVGSREFANLATAFGIRAQAAVAPGSDAALQAGNANVSDVLRGGAGGSVLHGGGMADVTAYGPVQTQAAGQVYRLYEAVLGRSPDYGGFQGWFDGLASGTLTPVQIAGAFAGSREFGLVYGSLDNAAFVALLYQNVLGRTAAPAEIAAWLALIDGGQSRAQVALGFANSQEFIRNSNPRLDAFMGQAQPNWNDVIEGGAGNDTMNGGLGADTFVFRRGQGGADVIHGLDPWDELQLSGFGFRTPGDALARMRQAGADVLFDHLGQQITFTNTALATMGRLRFNLS